MKIREVICKRWFLNKRIQAITVYPFIFYNGIPSVKVIGHEWAHIKQVRKIGWFKFYSTYLWWSIKKGYWNNPYEVEARKNSM